MSLHEPYVVYRLSIIMSESADYWNRMMRENDMDCDATLDAIQGGDTYSRKCRGCGEYILKQDSIDEDSSGKTIICEWCITTEQALEEDE